VVAVRFPEEPSQASLLNADNQIEGAEPVLGSSQRPFAPMIIEVSLVGHISFISYILFVSLTL
jgi:hypothetical protein